MAGDVEPSQGTVPMMVLGHCQGISHSGGGDQSPGDCPQCGVVCSHQGTQCQGGGRLRPAPCHSEQWSKKIAFINEDILRFIFI